MPLQLSKNSTLCILPPRLLFWLLKCKNKRFEYDVFIEFNQISKVGDGTNLVIVLVGEFLNNAEALLSQGLHPSEIISGYTKAAAKAQEILQGKQSILIFIFISFDYRYNQISSNSHLIC